MNTKGIFISFKKKYSSLPNKLYCSNSIDINDIIDIENNKHKESYIKLENTISHKNSSRKDYGFICEYENILVLNANRRKH